MGISFNREAQIDTKINLKEAQIGTKVAPDILLAISEIKISHKTGPKEHILTGKITGPKTETTTTGNHMAQDIKIRAVI